MFRFESPLLKATPKKRQSRFTALVEFEGEEIIAHLPTTNRIGDIENKNLPCLLSYHPDPKRKLKYSVEAVLLSEDDNWVGINQILSNKIVEYLLKENALPELISGYTEIKREVKLGISKLDFKVGDTYLEVKTPLTTLHIRYGDKIKQLPPSPFSSTDRMVKHIQELSHSLQEHERAIFCRSTSTGKQKKKSVYAQQIMKK